MDTPPIQIFYKATSFEVAFFVFRERVSFLLSAFYKNHCKNEWYYVANQRGPEHGDDVVTGNCQNNWRWEITTIESWTMRDAIPIEMILERIEASRWTDFLLI